jgi:hypothetical protein
LQLVIMSLQPKSELWLFSQTLAKVAHMLLTILPPSLYHHNMFWYLVMMTWINLVIIDLVNICEKILCDFLLNYQFVTQCCVLVFGLLQSWQLMQRST